MQYYNKVQRTIQKISKVCLDVVFPSRCPICDAIVPMPHERRREQMICEKCEANIVYIKEPVCKTCGRMIAFDTQEQCDDCKDKQRGFVQGKAVFLYTGKMKQSLYRFKYGNRKEYALFYAQEIVKKYGKWILQIQPQALIPIPLHRKRFKKRGYNQALEVAKIIGETLDIYVDEQIIQRKKDTIAQKQLSMQERKKNLNNAFFITENIVKYSCIIIIDDIYTTGTTLDKAAITLQQAGVENVYFICISIGKGL